MLKWMSNYLEAKGHSNRGEAFSWPETGLPRNSHPQTKYLTRRQRSAWAGLVHWRDTVAARGQSPLLLHAVHETILGQMCPFPIMGCSHTYKQGRQKKTAQVWHPLRFWVWKACSIITISTKKAVLNREEVKFWLLRKSKSRLPTQSKHVQLWLQADRRSWGLQYQRWSPASLLNPIPGGLFFNKVLGELCSICQLLGTVTELWNIFH